MTGVRTVSARARAALTTFVLALALSLIGLATASPVAAQGGGDPAVEAIDWLAIDGGGLSVRFDGGIAVIADACGRAELAYDLEPGIAGLRIEADAPEGLCPESRDILTGLIDVDGYQLVDGRLRLVDAAARPVVELAPRSPEALLPSGSWRAVGFDALGDGDLTEPRSGSALGVTFAAGSALDGRSDCGGFIGSHAFEAGSVFIGVRGFGIGPCSDRARAEEVAFTDALQTAEAWRRDGERLELLDAAGLVRVVLEAVSDSVAGSWVVTGIARNDGRIGTVDEEAFVVLELSDGGTFEGSSGSCPIEGSYLAEDDRIAFVAVVTDGPSCEGDERRTERRLLRALDRVIAWRRDGETLTLTDAVGEPLVELIAADAG